VVGRTRVIGQAEHGEHSNPLGVALPSYS
jgi:hypothetical protein